MSRIRFNANSSNSIYGNSSTVQPNSVTGYLYFYIGEVEQDANIIATSGLAESVSRKADADLGNVPSSKGILVESYHNGSSWYRVYSDGWCEQGSLYYRGNTLGWYTINLLIPFVDTNYSIQENRIGKGYSSKGTGDPDAIDILSNSSFRIGNDDGGDMSFNWVARGYTR